MQVNLQAFFMKRLTLLSCLLMSEIKFKSLA